jgi:histidine triad (HIT) family protein
MCIFCKIIKKEIPCHKVYENETNLAFLDVHPHVKGHTIVVPKEHRESFLDLSEQEMTNLVLMVRKTMEFLQEKLNCQGFNVGWNDGEVAGQVVPHLHVHIMPRYDGDGGGSMHTIINNPGDGSVEELFK